MTERDDITLLREFAATESEAAFAALVRRHINLVYSTALRSVGSAPAAEEISQAVFIILARKAKSLGAKTILAGWLHQTTRLTAANFLRGEIRRQKREQESYMQSTLNEPDANVWPQIAPLLDDALGKLGERDRNALVLRFFENKSLAEVGTALGASEDAAKMRVNRALEKLRKIFGKRGVALSATLIAGAVSASSVQAAPVGLAKTISAVAITKGAAAGGSTLTLVKGALKIMAWTKAKMAVVVTASLLLAAGTTTVLVKELPRSGHDVEHYFQTIGIPMTNGTWADFDKIPPNLLVLHKTHYADFHTPSILSGTGGKNGTIGRNLDFSCLMKSAYNFIYQHGGGTGVVLPADAPLDQYDFLATGPDALVKLQAEITRQLGYTASKEMQNVDVYALTIKNTNAPGLKLGRSQKGVFDPSDYFSDPFVFFLESHFHLPIVNRTGLKGEYTTPIEGLTWDYTDEDKSRATLRKYIRDQFGLELIKTNLPIEMLVVEKVK